MRRMFKNRGHGGTHQQVEIVDETGRVDRASGGDQGYIAYLLERLLYATAAHGTMEFVAYREIVRKEYAVAKGNALPGKDDEGRGEDTARVR